MKLSTLLSLSPLVASAQSILGSLSDYLIFDPPNSLSLEDFQESPAVFHVKLKPGVLKDNQKLQVTYRGENVNFDKCSLEFDSSNFDTFQPVSVSGAAIYNMEALPGTRGFDLEFQVFCSDGSCQNRGNGYRIERTYSSSATCKIFGDPHFVDFNGISFDYQGRGHFLLAKTPRLVVHGIFIPYGDGSTSVSQEIAFNYMGTAYSVFFELSGKLTLSQISNNDQHPVTPILDNIENPTSIIVNLPDGSQIVSSLYNYEIRLPGSYRNKTEGLCGKYDGQSPHANGDEWSVAAEDYLAKKPYVWSALPPIQHLALTCPVLGYPEIIKPVIETTSTIINESTAQPVAETIETDILPAAQSSTSLTPEPTAQPVTYEFETVKGIDTDVPTGYVAVKVEEVPQYVESPPAKEIVPQEQVLPISKADAEAHCLKVLDIPGCLTLVDRKPYVDACVTDCAARRTLDLAEASRVAYMSACQAAVKTHEQLGNEQKKSDCKTIKKALGFGSNDCPSNCNGRGSCSATGCICSGGFSGYDCSIPSSEYTNGNTPLAKEIAPEIKMKDGPPAEITVSDSPAVTQTLAESSITPGKAEVSAKPEAKNPINSPAAVVTAEVPSQTQNPANVMPAVADVTTEPQSTKQIPIESSPANESVIIAPQTASDDSASDEQTKVEVSNELEKLEQNTATDDKYFVDSSASFDSFSPIWALFLLALL